jgi:hypothetical protein
VSTKTISLPPDCDSNTRPTGAAPQHGSTRQQHFHTTKGAINMIKQLVTATGQMFQETFRTRCIRPGA